MIINNNLSNISKTTPASQVNFDKEKPQQQAAHVTQHSNTEQKGVDISISENVTTAFEQIKEHANSVDLQRVEQLRQQIADGSLTMDVARVSGNIVDTEF